MNQTATVAMLATAAGLAGLVGGFVVIRKRASRGWLRVGLVVLGLLSFAFLTLGVLGCVALLSSVHEPESYDRCQSASDCRDGRRCHVEHLASTEGVCVYDLIDAWNDKPVCRSTKECAAGQGCFGVFLLNCAAGACSVAAEGRCLQDSGTHLPCGQCPQGQDCVGGWLLECPGDDRTCTRDTPRCLEHDPKRFVRFL